MAFVPLVSSPHPTPDDTLPPNIAPSAFYVTVCVCQVQVAPDAVG